MYIPPAWFPRSRGLAQWSSGWPPLPTFRDPSGTCPGQTLRAFSDRAPVFFPLLPSSPSLTYTPCGSQASGAPPATPPFCTCCDASPYPRGPLSPVFVLSVGSPWLARAWTSCAHQEGRDETQMPPACHSLSPLELLFENSPIMCCDAPAEEGGGRSQPRSQVGIKASFAFLGLIWGDVRKPR